MAIRLVVVDDHPVFLHGLELIFRSEKDFQVVAACSAADEALTAIRREKPDVVVLDVHLPEKDGFAVLRELKQENLSSKVILITAGMTEKQAIGAMQLGVGGILLKETAPQTIVSCVRKVYRGGRWLDRDTLTRALDSMVKREAGARAAASVLTVRETEIVRMIVEGLRNKEVADRLSVSEGTVKTHLHNIYDKLNVGGRVELLLYAQEHNLV